MSGTNVTPITPKEAKNKNVNAFHPTMIEVINDLISKSYSKRGFTIKQKDIVDEFIKRAPEYTEKRVLNEKMLDFEEIYSKYGWKVNYVKPDYTENHFDPYFEFEEKVVRSDD